MPLPFSLIKACIEGDPDGAVENFIFNGGNVNERSNNGKSTLISWAARNGHLQLVKLLHSSGADLSAEEDGKSVLAFAVISGEVKVVDYLFHSGEVNLRQTTNKGETLIHLAAEKGHLDMINYLLDQVKNIINEIDTDGKSPLYQASWFGHSYIVERLCHEGADVELADKYGNGPLEVAKYRNHLNIASYLAYVQKTSKLQDRKNLLPFHQRL